MQWFPFRSKPKAPEASEAKGSAIAVSWTKEGAEFRVVPTRGGWLWNSGSFGADAELAMLLGQLEEEGYAEARGETVCLTWQDFYRVAASKDHGTSLEALKLPPVEQWRPALSSKETLIDEGFAVSIAGWLDPHGQRPQGNVSIEGAVIKAGKRVSILPESAWRVVESVAQFWARPSSERAADSNRRAWSAIRSHAARAGADMTDFLRKTVVLTPEKLRMGMRKGDVGGASMVELQPSFDGAPDRWLEIFDRIGDVPERYDIPDGNGIVHVMLAPEVRTVLREIRRMPGRRIAGDRAEAFLRNPFATLGPDAAKVIDPEQFEKARDDAGVSFARFRAQGIGGQAERGHARLRGAQRRASPDRRSAQIARFSPSRDCPHGASTERGRVVAAFVEPLADSLSWRAARRRHGLGQDNPAFDLHRGGH